MTAKKRTAKNGSKRSASTADTTSDRVSPTSAEVDPGVGDQGVNKTRELEKEPLRSAKAPAVVGIGASAGGLDAFTRLVRHLPADTGLAYVLVQHLDPTHPSLLPEILGRSARVPVLLAGDGMRMESDHAYVIPPGAAMTVTDGHLRVVKRERLRGVHTVIDAFLGSLADVHGSEAIGVILSGAGSDGSRGIEAIKEAGGITLAQDATSAQFPSMPENAAATGCIDFVMPPEKIAEQLARIGISSNQHDAESAGRKRDEEDVLKILLLLRTRTSVDFRHYRRATVHRRILRRMLAHRSESHGEYLAHIRTHPEELDALHADLLIGVTRFFRDPETFDELQRTGFPEMMKGRPGFSPIRVWVAGCSGGEETYSVAILLLEFLGDSAADHDIQIFATDLSASSIATARAGLYPKSIEADVSPQRLARFFTVEDGGYRIARRVRDLCVFATHNVLRDPPFSQLDLITCRNVLIYFDSVLQRGIMPTFHYALNPNGLLVVGSAESASPEYFVAFNKAHRIFKPKPGARRTFNLTLHPESLAAPSPRNPVASREPVAAAPDLIQRNADRLVLNRFGPPGVVVNERLEIVQFRGDTAGLVKNAAGVATLDVLKLARPEFLPGLRKVMERMKAGATTAREDDIVVRDQGTVKYVSLEAMSFQAGDAGTFYVVLFESSVGRLAEASRDAGPRPASALAPKGKRGRKNGQSLDELDELRQQLTEGKRHLQDIIEQYEASNEELRAAGEEIQSSNEELQSTNEELETTKEEVQSTNEELTTVNEELRHRNRDLAATSADLANVFASTQIPVVIVDVDLTIRRFTPVASQVFRIIPTDVGRPLGDIKPRVMIPDLEARVAGTIESLAAAQLDAVGEDGRWWTLTVRPYLTADRKVDGAVLVFTDIDAKKRFTETVEETSENRRRLLVEADAARAAAIQANLVKASFLANMSHDLRTPLTAIAGYTDLLELEVHGPLTPEQQMDLNRIKRSARHLLTLINDILNFAKVDAGHVELLMAAMPVARVLSLVEEMIHPQLRAKGLRFEAGECSASVMADEERVQQILLNLTTNAIKFTAAGSVAIRCDEDESVVRVHVTDTGQGISGDQLHRIFEPFLQLNRNLKSGNGDGVGLGLAISRELARRMGGDITATSELGVGSTFTLVLPRATD